MRQGPSGGIHRADAGAKSPTRNAGPMVRGGGRLSQMDAMVEERIVRAFHRRVGPCMRAVERNADCRYVSATWRDDMSTTKAHSKPAAKAAPWDKSNPKGEGEHRHLSPQAKAAAKRRAKAAGRPYPNLVDNMHEAAGRK